MEAAPVKALRWRCRRGMRELDQLLLAYLERRYPTANPEQKAAFVGLLEAQDPEIFGYLVRGVVPEHAPTATLVQEIIDNARSAPIRT